MTSPQSEPTVGDRQTPLVWVLVLHYQGADETIACLETLSRLDYSNFRILVVDNGSPDRDGDRVAAAYPQYDFVRNPDNLGFAGGCNAGIAHCRQQGAEWVWLLNNDTRVSPDSLSKLVAAAQRNPKAALLGAQVFTPLGDDYVASGGGEIDFRKGKTYERKKAPSDGSDMVCDWISGCNLLVRLEPFLSVGGFEEQFFLYYEDTDLCYRLGKIGWQSVMVPTASIKHIGLRSTEGSRSTWRHYYHIRNRLLFFKRHAAPHQQWQITMAVAAHLARHSITLPFRGEKGRRRLKAELLGFRDYTQERFGKAQCLDW